MIKRVVDQPLLEDNYGNDYLQGGHLLVFMSNDRVERADIIGTSLDYPPSGGTEYFRFTHAVEIVPIVADDGHLVTVWLEEPGRN